jgi:endophilin-A
MAMKSVCCNIASRAKMMAMKSVSKLRGQHNQMMYPQPEGVLSECMLKYGRELGDNSMFGQALTETGEGYKQLADIKYALEDSVKQNFIEPLQLLANKDLREVNHHRKKLTGRRLDYDCKKRKQQKGSTSVSEEEIHEAEEKFEESKQLAETAMMNLLENDAEQVSQLASFVDAELAFHQQSVDILQNVLSSLRSKCDEAGSRPKTHHVAKRVTSVRSTGSDRSPTTSQLYDSSPSSVYDPYSTASSSQNFSSTTAGGQGQATAEALYDFEPENQGEVSFHEGDIIQLISRVDDNWFEGSVGGKTGLFPVTYVKVLVDLP